VYGKSVAHLPSIKGNGATAMQDSCYGKHARCMAACAVQRRRLRLERTKHFPVGWSLALAAMLKTIC
jgi:hypothetical protein